MRKFPSNFSFCSTVDEKNSKNETAVCPTSKSSDNVDGVENEQRSMVATQPEAHELELVTVASV